MSRNRRRRRRIRRGGGGGFVLHMTVSAFVRLNMAKGHYAKWSHCVMCVFGVEKERKSVYACAKEKREYAKRQSNAQK